MEIGTTNWILEIISEMHSSYLGLAL